MDTLDTAISHNWNSNYLSLHLRDCFPGCYACSYIYVDSKRTTMTFGTGGYSGSSNDTFTSTRLFLCGHYSSLVLPGNIIVTAVGRMAIDKPTAGSPDALRSIPASTYRPN